MANFQESIDALKEAGLADLEILEIKSDSADGWVLTKNLLNNKESYHELPDKSSLPIPRHTQSVKEKHIVSV